jgi:hypothetical protein
VGSPTGTIGGRSAVELIETSGPTVLAMGAVADGGIFKRSGTTIVAATAGTDYLKASGLSGGQTIIGGTAGSDTLVAKPTVGSGTSITLSSGRLLLNAAVSSSYKVISTLASGASSYIAENDTGDQVQLINFGTTDTTFGIVTVAADTGMLTATNDLYIEAGNFGSSATATIRIQELKAGDIRMNLAGGKAYALGGVYGSASSGGTLTLASTSHATKGNISFGTVVYDETNKRLGTTGATAWNLGINNTTYMSIASDGLIQFPSANGGGNTFQFTRSGNQQLLKSGTGQLYIGTDATTRSVILFTNNSNRVIVDGNGSVAIGAAALGTTATDGFLMIPTCAGPPTGTPTAFTGTVALVYDTTNNKLYIYNGAWKGGTAPGTWS